MCTLSMPHPCVDCSKTVRRNQRAVSCDICERWTHLKCGTDISIEAYNHANTCGTELDFLCKECRPNPVDATFVVELHDAEPSETPAEDVVPDLSDLNISAASVSDVEEVLEASLPIPTLLDPIDMPTAPVTYSQISSGSQKGKPKLVTSEGYTFVLSRVRSHKTYWRCSVRNKKEVCKATVVQTSEDYSEGLHSHCHPPDPSLIVSVDMRAKIKNQAKNEVHRSASSIVEEAERDMDISGNVFEVRHTTLIRFANRSRRGMRPQEPRDLSFELVQSFLPDGFVRADVRVNGRRHLVMLTDRQIEHLSASRQWFVDGTFKIVKDPFYQLWTIHAFVRQDQSMKMVPLAFILMSSRKSLDYVRVLRHLRDLMPELQLQTVLCDFEMAVWRAFQRVFPGVKMRGCLFHWTQAVWRKSVDIGLRAAYLEDPQLRRFVKKILALPFLPHRDIPATVSRIQERLPESGQLRTLVDYVQIQWVENSTFTPRTWSVYNISTRTNNHVEGWNRRINSICRGLPLGIYRLIPVLHDEARLLPAQVHLIREGQMKTHTKKKAAKRQKDIFVAWRRHKHGEINTTQLLTQCSIVHGPVMS